jgi:hypothetical protein
LDPEALYVQLGRLVEAMPNLLESLPLPRSTQEWLGRVGALIAASDDVIDQAEFQTQWHDGTRPRRPGVPLVVVISRNGERSVILPAWRSDEPRPVDQPIAARPRSAAGKMPFSSVTRLRSILGKAPPHPNLAAHFAYRPRREISYSASVSIL